MVNINFDPSTIRRTVTDSDVIGRGSFQTNREPKTAK